MPTLQSFYFLLCLSLALPIYASEERPVQVIPVKKVGIVNLMDNEITNMHVGFTAFGNFKQKKIDDWGMVNYANGLIISKLADEHIFAVVVTPPNDIVEAIKKETYWTWNGNLNVKKAGAMKVYLENEKLDAIIELRSRELDDVIGRTSIKIEGHGLYTNGSAENPDDVVVYTMYMATIFFRDPFIGSKGYQCLLADRVTLPDMKGASLKSMSLQQMESIRPYLQSQLDLMIERLLTTGRMSKKKTPDCPKFN